MLIAVSRAGRDRESTLSCKVYEKAGSVREGGCRGGLGLCC